MAEQSQLKQSNDNFYGINPMKTKRFKLNLSGYFFSDKKACFVAGKNILKREYFPQLNYSSILLF